MREWAIIELLCAVVTLTTCASERGEWWEVNIAQGPVRGQKDTNEDLYVFYNIPYATAPTGEHKFKAPYPPPTWEETYDAIDKHIICPQLFADNLNIQEDCLITNIYVPNTKNRNLSVFVYIHGGGFQIGFGNLAKFTNLMKTKDIIIVTFNYRLGIHGFLCLGTEDVPGNAGLKDQVALLRWVHTNIAAFGGNPNDVTLAGGSAGSSSADLLMLSKVAEGLFNKVIPESGANIAVFSMQADPLENAKNHARTLNFTDVDNLAALEFFYKTLPFELLTADAFVDRLDSTFLFSPCIEQASSKESIFTENPLNILKRGDYKKVPMLYGFANMEGLIRSMFFDTWKVAMNEKFSNFLPANLIFQNDDEKENIAERVKKFYFGDKPISNDNVVGYVDYFSDVMFTYSILKAVELHVGNGHHQIYLYEYSFVDDDSVDPYTNIRGANHCSQSAAIADNLNPSEDKISEDYRKMKKILREIWHNFIKSGKPVLEVSSVPVWPPVGENLSPHMSLSSKIELRGVLLKERFQFWDNIYEKYYREPIKPIQP